MATLDAGEPILRVGYNEVWSQVKYQGRELYMLTQYLTAERPEGAADLPEETAEEEMTVSKASANLESSLSLETVSPQNPSADGATKLPDDGRRALAFPGGIQILLDWRNRGIGCGRLCCCVHLSKQTSILRCLLRVYRAHCVIGLRFFVDHILKGRDPVFEIRVGGRRRYPE